MPTYEFRCSRCEERQFITASFRQDLEPKCTKCEIPMHKVFGSPPVTFKGSGWASKEK
jgi:putative FmdB family regulatory protein